MRNNRCLVITERFYPEEFLINELVEEWGKNKLDVTVLTQTPTYPYGKTFEGYKNRFFSKDNWRNVIIRRFYCVTGYRENKFLKALGFANFVIWTSLYALFRGYKYDKIFVYQVGALTVGIPAIIIKKLYGKKVTIWSQDIWPDTVSPNGFSGWKKKFQLRILEGLVRLIYNNCDEIIVSCKPFIKRINDYFPNKKIHYLPNWASGNYNENRIEQKFLSNKINFTFAGNINKWRSLDIIIECFHEFNKNHRNAQLNIIGDGSGLESLKKFVKVRYITDVVFWGRKPSSEMDSYYKGSDILIISLAPNPCYSLYLPAKFSTYLSTGKPIFAIMNGAVPELMSNYKIGFYTSPDKKEAIIKGFSKLCSISELERNQIKKNSMVLLKKEFDKRKIIDSITQIVFQ